MKKIILFFLISFLIISSFQNINEVVAKECNIIFLKNISIIPTDIANFKNNNYMYNFDGDKCLKVEKIKIKDDFQECILNDEIMYMIKDDCYKFDLSKFKIENNVKINHTITINFQTFFKFGDFNYEIKNNYDEIKLYVNKNIESGEKDYFITFNNVNSSRGGISFKIILQYEVL